MKEMSKGKMKLFVATLFATNVALMCDMVIIPTIGSLFTTFGDSVNLVNFIISGPVLMFMVSSLICAKLMQYVSKRTLLIVGYAIFTVASIFGVAIENAVYMAIMRALVGIGEGLVNVPALALIAELFIDEKRRSSILGAYNSAQAAIGAVLSIFAGFVAANAWQSVFKIYWISIPILIMVILFIPKTPAESAKTDDNGLVQKKEPIPLLSFGTLCMGAFMLNLLYTVVFYMIALYVSENAIGNESVVGILSSLGTVGSATACIIFGVVYTKLKRATIIPSYVLLAVCYFLLVVTHNSFIVAIACTFLGAAFGNGLSYYIMRSTVIVPSTQTSTAIALVISAGLVGGFLSTYFASGLQSFMGVNTVTAIIPVLVGFSVIGAVLSIILTIRDRSHPSESTEYILNTEPIE